MTSKRPHSLSELLDTGSLADLAAEARRRESLTERIRSLLPANEAAHLVAANRTEAGELVLMMDSSVWAARVRYRAEELGTERLRVRVLPRTDQSGNPGTS
jgi:hypothetical protein